MSGSAHLLAGGPSRRARPVPDRALNQIMAATDTADVAQMAMIEAMRQLADNGKATNRILEGMQAELRDVRERVIRIEAAEYKSEIQEAKALAEGARIAALEKVGSIESRVQSLELDKHRRDMALSLAGWFGRNWPITALLLALGAFVAWADKVFQ